MTKFLAAILAVVFAAIGITPIGTVPAGDCPLRGGYRSPYALAPGSRFNPEHSRRIDVQREILQVVTIGSLEFKVYVIQEKNGIQRIEFHRVGRLRLPGTIPDMFAYSCLIPGDEKNQGLRGVSIVEGLRDKKLLRPLLNTFFAIFPDVNRTHPKMMNPIALALLNKEYGFAPVSDVSPNAYVGRNGKKNALYFISREARELFLCNAGSGLMAQVMSDYEIVEHNFVGSSPLYLGQPLIVKDETSFQVAMVRFRWLMPPELLRTLRENLLLSQARVTRLEALAVNPLRASNLASGSRFGTKKAGAVVECFR